MTTEIVHSPSNHISELLVRESCIESCNTSQRHLSAETPDIARSDSHVHFWLVRQFQVSGPNGQQSKYF